MSSMCRLADYFYCSTSLEERLALGTLLTRTRPTLGDTWVRWTRETHQHEQREVPEIVKLNEEQQSKYDSEGWAKQWNTTEFLDWAYLKPAGISLKQAEEWFNLDDGNLVEARRAIASGLPLREHRAYRDAGVRLTSRRVLVAEGIRLDGLVVQFGSLEEAVRRVKTLADARAYISELAAREEVAAEVREEVTVVPEKVVDLVTLPVAELVVIPEVVEVAVVVRETPSRVVQPTPKAIPLGTRVLMEVARLSLRVVAVSFRIVGAAVDSTCRRSKP